MNTMASENPSPHKNRRLFSRAYKRQVVEQTFEEGAQVSQVARRHDVATTQVYKWRKLYRQGRLADEVESTEPRSFQVFMQGASSSSPVAPEADRDTPSPNELVLFLANGHRLELRGLVDTAALRVALETLC